jgi:hypothetical protein
MRDRQNWGGVGRRLGNIDTGPVARCESFPSPSILILEASVDGAQLGSQRWLRLYPDRLYVESAVLAIGLGAVISDMGTPVHARADRGSLIPGVTDAGV